MKTMELHYAKQMKDDGEERDYQTWKWNDGSERHTEVGWEKVSTPKFSCGETAGKLNTDDGQQQAEAWFTISNREDLIFLEKEKISCDYFIDAEKHEIHVAQTVLAA